jgi:hypothetical protein
METFGTVLSAFLMKWMLTRLNMLLVLQAPRSHHAISPILTRMLDKFVASISFWQEEYF